MRNLFLLLPLALLVPEPRPLPAPASVPVSASAAGPRPEDVTSMESILAALYDVISGPAGQQRDWDRMRAMFVPGARLIPTVYRPDSVPTMRVLDLDGYIGRSGPLLERCRRTPKFPHP